MTEHLSSPLETPEGTVRCPIYGTTPLTGYKAKKCRCDVCVNAQRKSSWERRHPGEPYVPKPKRPPGIVWTDWSGITAVVRCERCQKNYGVWLSESEAAEFADAHRYLHVEDPPFDWASYDAARLMKQPGGRPPIEVKPLCREDDCLNDARAGGLCDTHYRRVLRAEARSQVEFSYKVQKAPSSAPRARGICKASMCSSRPVSKGLCEVHL